MRGSLLAVVAIAVIAGLGVVFAVRTLGLLTPPSAVVEVPYTPPPTPPPPSVLVPSRQLFQGDTITQPGETRVRFLRADEVNDYNAHKDDYLPPEPAVAYLRYMARDAAADRPLRRADLEEAKKPEALRTRLSPGTRAVSVAVPKERSVGGLIQVGDWVDVYLNTEVGRSDGVAGVPHTALLVPHAQVVAKRDTLYSLYAVLPDPVPFTLATNPYRAALIEYGRTVGTLSLVPVSADDKKRLDKLRDDGVNDPANAVAITFAPPDSPEYAAEQGRIEAYAAGSTAIGTDDLARVLRLVPIAPAASGRIEFYSGVNRTGVATFPVGPPASAYYFFQMPGKPPAPKPPGERN